MTPALEKALGIDALRELVEGIEAAVVTGEAEAGAALADAAAQLSNEMAAAMDEATAAVIELASRLTIARRAIETSQAPN